MKQTKKSADRGSAMVVERKEILSIPHVVVVIIVDGGEEANT